MLPLLLVLGATGALLEIKRLVSKPPKEGDLFRLQQSEEKLKRVLQEVQRELQQEKSEHHRDQARAEELDRVAQELRAAQAELARKSRELEQKAIGLTEENEDLLRKVDNLHAQHEQELRHEHKKFEAELDFLKREVARVFEAFSDGSISAEILLDKLTDLGVDVELTADELRALPEWSEEDGAKQIQQVELQVDSNWRSHLRLLSDDPERMARQLAEGAHRAALPARGLSSSSQFSSVKTPPRERREGNLFGGVPSLALSVFTPRIGSEKENITDPAKSLTAKTATTQPLQIRPLPNAPVGSPSAKTPTIFQNKKAQTPTRKKPPPVPRLGLSVVLRGEQSRSTRDAFAMSELSIDDVDHQMLNKGIMRH